MFAKIVGNQYIGKAKIDFTFNSKIIDGKNLIGDIGFSFQDGEGKPFSNLDSHFPDYFIMGQVSDISTMELCPLDLRKTKILYITGIHKLAPNLEDYELKNVLWSSYYEDNYRGYLFQMVSSNSLVELKNPKSESYKINLQIHETRGIHCTVSDESRELRI